MNKSTQNLLIGGAVLFAVYYFMKNSASAANPNAATPAEIAQSNAITQAAIDAQSIGLTSF